MNLSGKTALITGANQGLGYEIAKHYVQAGANVMLCARNAERLEKARNELTQLAANNKVISKVTDISDEKQTDSLINVTLEAFDKIDILIANAGVYGTKGPIDEVDWDEWKQAININLIGTVYLARSVFALMKKQKNGKIIFISGGGATKPLPNLSAYAVSKAGLVRFAETLAEEAKLYGIDVNAIAPGALNTRLLDEILEAGPEKVGDAFYQQALKQQSSGGTPLSKGAELCVYLGTDASKSITGKLLSAVWDPWQDLSNYLDDIQTTDIYTLRRIVPKDRGKNWG